MKVIDKLVDIANNGVSETAQYFRYYNRSAHLFDSCLLTLGSLIYKLNNGSLDINDEIKVIDDETEDTSKEDKKIEKIGAYNIKKFCEDYPEMGRMIKDMYIKQDEIIDHINEKEGV